MQQVPNNNNNNNQPSDEIELSEDGTTLRIKGEVIEVLPGTLFKVKLINDAIVLAHTSGKMRKHRIRVLLYDIVSVEISISDAENLKRKDIIVNGRIAFRYKA